MKRTLIITIILFTLVGIGKTYIFENPNVNRSDTEPKSILYRNQLFIDEPNEELYEQLFITLIYPHVEKAIQDYYDDYMTYLPTEDPWSYKFLSIKKIPEQNYSYVIKLEVQPYVGPHLSVGVDHITFKIRLGRVTIEKYQHLKSYELPPHYEDIFKKKLPSA